jgi:hypothetical protein
MGERRQVIVDYVQPQVREWSGQNGTVYFVTVNFADESQGSLGVNSKEKAEQTQEILRGLMGKPTEFELEADGEYQGTPKFKIRDFPGKLGGGGGGGGNRGGGGGMQHSQAGLLAAASVVGPFAATLNLIENDGDVAMVTALTQEIAEQFTEYLFARRKDAGAGDGGNGGSTVTPEPASAPPPASERITLPQIKRVKELGSLKGLDEAGILAAAGVDKLGDLTAADAETLIAAWTPA